MDKKGIIQHLNSNNSTQLYKKADKIRKEYCGDQVHLRGIIEFSNYCEKDCFYCGLRKSNKKITRYRISNHEILESVKKAVRLGYKTIVLQSGEDSFYSTDDICQIIKSIKDNFDLAVTLSIGEKEYADYLKLKKAGADRYLLKFETSNRKLFKKLKPDSDFNLRMKRIRWLKQIGFQVGSGNIVGLPNQSIQDLADDIVMINQLDLDMVGVGPFIPHPHTPLSKSKLGTLDLVLKIVSLLRIITKNTHLPATTAVGSIDKTGRQKALRAGANVLMPNVTSRKYRKYYEIYPNKICVDENRLDCKNCMARMVKTLNRKIGMGYGHSLKK
jgi:biotin synthase